VVWSWEVSKNWGNKKNYKPCKNNISPIGWDASTAAITLNFGMLGDASADNQPHQILHQSVLTPQVLAFSTGLSACPYNTVSITSNMQYPTTLQTQNCCNNHT